MPLMDIITTMSTSIDDLAGRRYYRIRPSRAYSLIYWSPIWCHLPAPTGGNKCPNELWVVADARAPQCCSGQIID